MPRDLLGILSLDTAFERIIGDVGNPQTYPFPTLINVVSGADSPAIVKDGTLDEALLAEFETAALRLQAQGARAIISTCGFLITAQQRIAGAVDVPVMLSGLSLYPMVRSVTQGRIGLLTASQEALGAAALAAAGIQDQDVVIQGMEQSPRFAQTFLAPRDQQERSLDRAAMQTEVVASARSLLARAPDVAAIILECGNLPPYAQALRQATGLPVYHLAQAAVWLMASHGAGQSAPHA